MRLSSNALVLYFLLAATTNVVNVYGFVLRPAQIPAATPIEINPHRGGTALGYIKEGYETGIGPDILRKQKKDKKKGQQLENPVVDPVVVEEFIRVDDYIDAVVIEDIHSSTSKSSSSSSSASTMEDYDRVVVENTKRYVSTKKPADIFPEEYVAPTPSAVEPSIWDTNTAKTIQGGALKTWSMEAPEVDHTQVLLKSTHWNNPLRAQIDVWNGPGHAPMKLAVYCNANTPSQQPFSFVIPTPGYNQQSIGIKNSGPLEFPIEAVVIADMEAAREQQKRKQSNYNRKQQQQQQQQQQQPFQQGGYSGFYKSIDPNAGKAKSTSGLGLFAEKLRELGDLRKIDGTSPVEYASDEHCSSEELFEFEKNVDSVQVLIETNGLCCQARVEVTSDGSDEMQQVIELSIEDAKERPFFAVLDTSLRSSTTVRIVNLDPYSAFPITACVEPYTISCDEDDNHDFNDNDGGKQYDLDFIDANIEDKQGKEEGDEDETTSSTNGTANSIEDECRVHSVPDVTIPATYADYDFDEDFFFAN
mmetsp:Transcript_17733/g.37055  ORF Transcript_17733/g.37055 Transcript_17733/m.37055 type:complete len:531 (-) Transcript_17733:702-2294(-)